MRVPREVYQMSEALSVHLACLTGAQRRGLALWVYGAVLAHSACQSAVTATLLAATAFGGYDALRQRLREWLYDGADKAKPCARAVAVELCFAPLLGWVLAWWQGPRQLALAIDATTHGARLTALVVSVLYRGSAIPVAWVILPGNTKGPWLAPLLGLLRRLRPAVPRRAGWRVLVLADRGLWSPRLWRALRALGWHSLARVQNHITAAPAGRERCRARDLVPRPDTAWVGRARLGAAPRARLCRVTLIVVWRADQKEPWAVASDLPPARVGVSWYALRMWIELGFRVLKSLGWQWQRTRRDDPARAARHWLVLAVATLWTLAHGTRAEAAAIPAPAITRTSADRPRQTPRRISVFRRGLECFAQCLLARGRPWHHLWFAPEPWPEPPPGLQIIRHETPS
jgi:hypothetical protein